jgi:hypothetical protein
MTPRVVEPLTAAEREELDYAWSHRAGRIPANGLRLLRQLEQVEAERKALREMGERWSNYEDGPMTAMIAAVRLCGKEVLEALALPEQSEEEAREYTACHPDCRADAGAGLHHRECQVADAD